MNKLTLEQIAEYAGVSRSTVSRVLNEKDGVSPEVREKVLAIISKTGYQPNLAARSLAAKRSGVIGLVISQKAGHIFADPYFPQLIQGITQVCNENEYAIVLFLFHSHEDEKKLHFRLNQPGFCDGFLVTAVHTYDPLVSYLRHNDLPFVVIGRPHNEPDASYVDVDNVGSAYTAVRHLIQQGRRKIATITGPSDTLSGIDRQNGYLQALHDRNVYQYPNLIVEGNYTETSGYLGMKHLLPHQPDAVFAASDSMAIGALRAIREQGLSVPEDIAVVGFDDLPVAGLTTPALTTVRQPIQKTGAMAATTLLDMLANESNPPRHIVLNTDLVIRQSCGLISAG